MTETNVPGAPLAHFAHTLEVSTALLGKVPNERFHSPYSVIPLVTQFLGLTTPVEGSGDSPYSLCHIAFELRGSGPVLLELAEIPMAARREVIDEMHEAIAPILLEETAAYVDLLVDTRYREALATPALEAAFRESMRAKLELLRVFVGRFRSHAPMWAHLAHAGFEDDIVRENPFLRDLDPDRRKRWLEHAFPSVIEASFDGWRPGGGEPVSARGWMIVLSSSTEQLLVDRNVRSRKLAQATALAQKLGARVVGMAGLIASFARGGHGLKKGSPDVGFTTGHAFTIANILDVVRGAVDEVGIDTARACVAVVGAGGSIGSGCARLVAEQLRPARLLLTDISPLIAETTLAKLADELRAQHAGLVVDVSSDNADIREADVVIVATNASSAILDGSYFRPGAIVVDDAFPKNVDRSTLAERDDVVVLEGGLVQLPYSIHVDAARTAQDTMDAPISRFASCKQVYGCLAETLILCVRDHRGDYGLGAADPVLAREVFGWGRELGLSRAPMQCFDSAVSRERIARARARVAERGLART